MRNFYTSWPITPNEQLIFTLDFPAEETVKFDMVTVTYQTPHKSFALNNDYLGNTLQALVWQLNEALSGNLRLDVTIDKNATISSLGYGWQLCLYQFYNDDLPLEAKNNKWFGTELKQYNFSSQENDWVGIRYKLWSFDKKLTDSWIYTKNNKIFLEISPQFNWNKFTSSSVKNQKSFDAFMENFKPLVVTEISQGTAQKLLEKASAWFKQIEVIWPDNGFRK